MSKSRILPDLKWQLEEVGYGNEVILSKCLQVKFSEDNTIGLLKGLAKSGKVWKVFDTWANAWTLSGLSMDVQGQLHALIRSMRDRRYKFVQSDIHII